MAISSTVTSTEEEPDRNCSVGGNDIKLYSTDILCCDSWWSMAKDQADPCSWNRSYYTSAACWRCWELTGFAKLSIFAALAKPTTGLVTDVPCLLPLKSRMSACAERVASHSLIRSAGFRLRRNDLIGKKLSRYALQSKMRCPAVAA